MNLKIERQSKGNKMLKGNDFSKGVRGKYAHRYARGTNVVVLQEDVAKLFPDSASVNQALRLLAQVAARKRAAA
jgi:hypothetical protein